MAFDFNSLSTTPLSQKERLTIGTTTPQSSGAFNFNELPKSPIEIIASKLHGYGVNTPESYGLSKPAVSQTTTQWGIGIKPEQQRTNATAVTTPQVAEQIPEPKTYFEALADTVDAITEQGRKSKEQYERGEISGATKYSGDVANITSLAVAPIGELFNQVPLVGGIMRVMSEGLQFGPKGAGEALSNLPGYKQILEKNPWITDYSEAVSPTVENATITALNLATLLGTVESGIKAGVRGKTALEYRVTRDTDGKLLTRNGDGDVVYIEDKNGVPTYGEKPADYPLIRLNSALQDLKKSSGEAIENKKVAKNAETVKEIITGTKSGQNWWAQNAEADAASQRVAAKVDLSTSIDTTGTVNTKPQQEYFKQTYLDKTEATGYKLLEKEDASVNLQRISDKLVEEFGNTNLPQSIVKKAIETILRKLSTTADELGNVKLLETAKEKSAAQRSANYERTQNNTNNEIKNKTVGRALRLVVEETSKTDIAKVNGELSKLYQELAILERLDAMKVAGGKLGKYFSQISGNIVGGLAGGAVGGPVGAAATAVVGGELASALRGRIMAGKFKSTTPKGEIGATLEKAIAETKKPKKVDLKTPDKKVGAPKTVKKTPEIVKLEAKIAKNVEAQKAAIKAKDYTLVAKLKKAYDVLVAELKKAIKYLNENGSVGMSIKKTVTPESVAKRADDADMGVLDYVIRDYDNAILDPNVNRTLSDMGLGKATRDERIRFAKDVFDEQAGVGGKVTIKTDPLVEEAKKYKSAEEFVKAKTTRPDYGYGHSPNEDGVRAFNLTEKVDGEQMIPEDMYSQWYGSRGTPEDLESITVLKRIKGNPEAEVTIYRASPKDEWNYGDWTTFSKKYAEQHAEGNNLNVFSKKVKAKDVRWAMDDINEFGYFPEDYKSQLTDIWKKANKTDPLVEEAKGKSLEEYIKSSEFKTEYARTKLKVAEDGKPITVTVYHGTPDGRFLEEFDPTKKGYFKDAPELLPDNTTWNELYGGTNKGFRSGGKDALDVGVYDGISFTDDARVAKSYADKPAFDSNNSVPMVVERTVTLNNPKVIDVASGEWDLPLEKNIQKAKEEGYDGLILKNIKDNYHPWTTKSPSNNVVVFDPKSILTKSQLTDIWKKANRKDVVLKKSDDLAAQAKKSIKPFEKTLYRGSGGGGGLIARPDIGNALGEGRYYAGLSHAVRYGKNIEEKVVKLKNPLYIKTDQDLRNITGGKNLVVSEKTGVTPEMVKKQISEVRKKIIEQGYDGVVIEMANYQDTQNLRRLFEHDQVIVY